MIQNSLKYLSVVMVVGLVGALVRHLTSLDPVMIWTSVGTVEGVFLYRLILTPKE